jgi:hypothetical protein
VRKKVPLIIAVFAVAVIVMSLSVWVQLHPEIPHRYERTIARNFVTQDEERALLAAESINYSAITSWERFDGSSDPEAYLHPGTYLAYTGANFIDSQTIVYYETRYDNLQGKEGPQYPKQIELIYEANVQKRSEFRIYNSPAPQGVTWHNTTIVMSAPNGTVSLSSGNMQFFYKNQSSYQMTEWAYDFNFSNCYFVKMDLKYSEIYAPTAAFFSHVYQIVVLDDNFVPVLIGLESGTAVS